MFSEGNQSRFFAVKQEVQTLLSRIVGKKGVAGRLESRAFIFKPTACSLPVRFGCLLDGQAYRPLTLVDNIMARRFSPKK